MSSNTDVTDIKEYRSKNKRAGNVHWVLYGLFIILCILGGYFFSISPFFYIEEINVSGNAFVDSQRIIELSGLKKGDNIFAASLAGVESWLRIEPYIKSSVITRKLPNTINIKVEERIPVAVLPTGRGFLFIDDAGRVLSRKTQVADLPLPLIVGVAGLPVGVVAGTMLDDPQIKVGLSIVSQMPVEALDIISEINVKDPQKIIIYTTDQIEVRIGDSTDFKNKFIIMNRILEQLSLNSKKDSVQYVDISLPDKPVIFY